MNIYSVDTRTLFVQLILIVPSNVQRRQLKKLIRAHIDMSEMAYSIINSIVHSKFLYSLYCNLLNSQIDRLQHIQNSLARAVIEVSNPLIPHLLKSRHWLKIVEHTEYKLLSVTYKLLTLHCTI